MMRKACLSVLLVVAACGGSSQPAPAAAPPAAAPRRELASGFVDGPAGKIRVDDGGSGGVPVLFVHGLSGRHDVWKSQLGHLRASRRAAALDLRGHGESAGGGDYTIDA